MKYSEYSNLISQCILPLKHSPILFWQNSLSHTSSLKWSTLRQEPLIESDFIFNNGGKTYFSCNKATLKRNGSNIKSLDWLQNKKPN